MRRGRFAPSPSGALHLGSARTALANELWTRSVGGAVVLRIEDLDATRVVPGATDAMLDALRWLGLAWDEGPDVGGPSLPYLQSGRRALYDAALELLRRAGRVYPCACSRRDIEIASQAPHGAEAVYPGTCRGRDHAETIATARARGRAPAWRFEVNGGWVQFVDGIMGPYRQDVAREVGDFVVYRADGVPAYQLAVVVDDLAMGITDVVRGADLLASTPRQLLLIDALNGRPPRFAHVPLVVGEDGVRLAKRHGSISLAELRGSGVRADRIRSALEASLGYAGGRFDPRAIPPAPASIVDLRRILPELEASPKPRAGVAE